MGEEQRGICRFESVRGGGEGKLRFSKSPHPNLTCQLLHLYGKGRRVLREGGRKEEARKREGSGSWVGEHEEGLRGGRKYKRMGNKTERNLGDMRKEGEKWGRTEA